MEIDDKPRELVERVKPQTLAWRKMTIAIDGVDGAGKSTVSRFLAWQLGMPVVKTDMVALPGSRTPTCDSALVQKLVESRHKDDRPLIVEGVFVLRTLDAISIEPEILIRVESEGHDGSILTWQSLFASYAKEHARAVKPDYTYSRRDAHAA